MEFRIASIRNGPSRFSILFVFLLYFQELAFYGNTLRMNTDLKGKAKLIEIPSSPHVRKTELTLISQEHLLVISRVGIRNS